MQRRALVVDEDLVLCELIKSVLTPNGMDVLAFTKGIDAVAHVKKEKFDVIFLSLGMPRPDGLDLAREMRLGGFNRMTPIIMMSSDQHPTALTRGFEAGASFFLYKPIDKKLMLRIVQAAHGQIEHERRRFRRIPFQSKVRMKFDRGEVECETIDVSLNGMLVTAPFTFPIGSAAQLSLHLSPGMKPIIASGSVMRTIDGNRMGIQFNGITHTESGRLQEFLLPFIDSRRTA